MISSTNKPSITQAQLVRLCEQLDDACLGKTPFHCADGTSSDRLFTTLSNVITDYFTIVKEAK